MRARLLLLASLSSLSWGWLAPEQEPSPAEAIADAARALLETLTPEQRARAQYPLDAPERLDWHFTPRERPGLPLLDLSVEQRVAVGGLLRTALGSEGRETVAKVQELDTVLREMAERQGQKADYRNPLLYEVAIFGEPSAQAAWAFRFEGHHVSISVATDGHGAFSFSPCFLGANPLRIPEGARTGERVLSAREEAGRNLLASLSVEQRKAAHVAAEAPREIALLPGQALDRLTPVGIKGKELEEQQRTELLGLIRQFLGDLHPDLAGHALLEQAREQMAEIRFAWMGSSERGQQHGFRVQTPRFVIEWTTVQGDANHVHACWRDLERDLSLGWGLPQVGVR